MAKHEHFLLDKEGLKQLLVRIRDRFATQKALKEETNRAKVREQQIVEYASSEIKKLNDRDAQLSDAITAEAGRAKSAENVLDGRVTTIENKIPTQASAENQLADKEFVNSSISTATATFRGTFDSLEELQATPGDMNDYAFHRHKDEPGNTLFDRYKYVGIEPTKPWVYEYTLNNSSFTAKQWAAINSGITEDILKECDEAIKALETAINDEVSRATGAESTLQSNIDAIYKKETLVSGTPSSVGASKETGILIDKVSAETKRSSGEESRIEKKIDKEVEERTTETSAIKSDLKTTMRGLETEVEERTTETRAIKKDLRTIDEKVDKEIEDRTKADSTLDERVTALEKGGGAGTIKDVKLDGKTKVESGIANIKSSDILTLNEITTEELPEIGEPFKLYKKGDKIYQYTSIGWKELGEGVQGKAYIKVMDSLPETGEEDVFIIKREGHVVHQWVGVSEKVPTGWKEIGGSDEKLREDFTAHLIDENAHAAIMITKANVVDLANHMNDKNNPHEVTKLQIGLGNVDNTSDDEKPISAATQTALNSKVDLSTYTVEVGLKVNYTDIKDNLDTVDPLVPLSANQGTVLDAKIRTLDTKMQSFGSALLFRGVVPSIAALELITEKNIGDCYQINSQVNSEVNDSENHDGEMWAWNGTSWVKIVATATDLSSMLATTAEINKIISDYV